VLEQVKMGENVWNGEESEHTNRGDGHLNFG
jgi:hypothetical protein